MDDRRGDDRRGDGGGRRDDGYDRDRRRRRDDDRRDDRRDRRDDRDRRGDRRDNRDRDRDRRDRGDRGRSANENGRRDQSPPSNLKDQDGLDNGQFLENDRNARSPVVDPREMRESSEQQQSGGEPTGYAGFDIQKFQELAESGELDVYTCLGLSDATTWSPDTQALANRIVAALFMQLAVPALMLYLEMVKIESTDAASMHTGHEQWWQLAFDCLKPGRGGVAFRGIGATMLCYSLYSMYGNAQDECRCSFMHFAFQERIQVGIWWPLLLGEIANIGVSFVLLLTLYFIFCNITDGADLVLNAVAVNFLGGVDAEFVNRESFVDAISNVKGILKPFKHLSASTEPCWSKAVEALLHCCLQVFVLMGVALAGIFLFAPSRDGEPWNSGF